MKDEKIVELLFARDETALKEARTKYIKLCFSVAESILSIHEDREECVNDAFLELWNTVPPKRPENLCAYITRIVKNIALNRSRSNNAWKRVANYGCAGDELLEILPDVNDTANAYESKKIGEVINRVLQESRKYDRDVFVLRYWYGDSVPQISRSTGFSESKIKSLLKRMRAKLAKELLKEGIEI